MTWPDVERALRTWPRERVAGLTAAAARACLPRVAELEPVYGPEATEWLAACERTVAAVEAFARGEPVTRFALRLAADAARSAAAATADRAREVGPSPFVEAAELAYAAAAFAADCARAGTAERAAALAMQALRAAAGGGDVPDKLAAVVDAQPSPAQAAEPE
jgi:hypothetical protein